MQRQVAKSTAAHDVNGPYVLSKLMPSSILVCLVQAVYKLHASAGTYICHCKWVIIWVRQVHAALAAMLYGEKPPAVQRAEVQWEIASEFDTRFADPVWVAREKHWPPAMLQALKHFLNLGQ